MRSLLAPLLLVAACGGDNPSSSPDMADPLALTAGVTLTPTGCPYQVTTPAQTTNPLPDDGSTLGAPTSLHLGYGGDPATSIAILWNTDVATTGSRVDFGVGQASQHATGFSFAYPTDLAGTDPPSVRVHEIHLCGLTPGTTYTYQIPGTTLGGSFATAPQGSGMVRFAIAGDSRGNAPMFGKIVEAAHQQGAEFLVYTGDAVDLGSIQSAWDDWFAAGKDVLPSLPILSANGNHEGNARHYYAQMALPGKGTEEWYSVDWGDLHLVALNDTPTVATSITGAQKDFLAQDLAATQKKWKVVFHHKALFSSSTHGSQTDLQQAWEATYDQYAVDLVANGHDHDYERSKPLKAGQPVSSGGTYYQVNGGGGADLYPAGTSAFTELSKSTYAFSIVDVTPTQMTVTAYDMSPSTPTQLDQFQITK